MFQGLVFLDVVLDDEGFSGCCVGFDYPKTMTSKSNLVIPQHLNASHALFCILV